VSDELTQDQWQKRFDDDFPRGLIIELSYGDIATDPTYTSPRVSVTGMNGIMPMVYLSIVASSKSFDLSVASYKIEQTEPVVVADVISADGQRWRWSSGVSDEMAEILIPLRDDPNVTLKFED
jgi:hypothetical protein